MRDHDQALSDYYAGLEEIQPSASLDARILDSIKNRQSWRSFVLVPVAAAAAVYFMLLLSAAPVSGPVAVPREVREAQLAAAEPQPVPQGFGINPWHRRYPV